MVAGGKLGNGRLLLVVGWFGYKKFCNQSIQPRYPMNSRDFLFMLFEKRLETFFNTLLRSLFAV